jgi:glycosyltransferase involved in cell wall biosynthesis
MTRVLLTVSGTIPADLDAQVAGGARPRPDYVEMARAMDADLLDVAEARRTAGPLGALLARFAGPGPLLAWACFRRRKRYDAIFTDGEQVGLPLAVLGRLTGRRLPVHVMIVHILSVPKKAKLVKLLRLAPLVDRYVVYASSQRRFLIDELGVPEGAVALTSFMVDTSFWAPEAAAARPGPRMICSAGLERRDYPTMMAAVRDLDVRVVLAAASPWSKQADSTAHAAVPANVEVTKLGFADLRQLYADAAFVVMPLVDTPFQAGVTTILEAMAMGRAVVCTRTEGQTDVITDGVDGVYVAPADPSALRATITALLDDPERAAGLGARARAHVVAEADVAVYAARLAAVTRDAVAERARRA